jgi:hypothetical protein
MDVSIEQVAAWLKISVAEVERRISERLSLHAFRVRYGPVLPNKVYVIGFESSITIGSSRNVDNIVKKLRRICKYPLNIISTIAADVSIEKALHKRFHHLKLNDLTLPHPDEWFRLEGDLKDWIDGGCVL